MKFTAQPKLKNSLIIRLFAVVLLSVSFYLIIFQNPSQVEASINQALSYQIKVSNPDGTNLTTAEADCLSGTCNFKASLYDALTGGTLVWQDTIATTVGDNGIATLKLDCSGTFANCNLNGGPNFNSGELFLLVEFQPDSGGSYEAFSPRVELVAAPYAFNAYQLDGYGSGDFVKFIESTAQEDTSTDSSIFINKTGEGGYILQLQNDAVDAFLIDYEGKVGIGAASSSALLQLGTTGKLGTLGFAGSTSGLVTVQPAAAAGTWTLTLPTSAGTDGYVLSTDGSGVTTWSAVTSLVAADTWDYDDFVDTMSLDANLITNQTTYTSTHNYTGTTTTGFTYNADSVTTASAVEISADGLTTGSGVRLSSTSIAGKASGTSSVLYIDRSGTNAYNAHISTGININVANTGPSAINRGVQSNAYGGGTNYAGYFLANGTSGMKLGVYSSITEASVETSYAGYYSNAATNSTTDGIKKYGVYITSTGNFLGSTGAATTNYGLYVNTVSGADANYAAVFAGGNVGIGTSSPSALLSLFGPLYTIPNLNIERYDTSIITGDGLGVIEFAGRDATVLDQIGAKIYAVADNTWDGGTNDAPTRLEFFVQSDGTSDSMTAPAMTIDSTGYVGVGTQAPSVNLHVYRAADADIFRLQDSDGSCLANPESGAVTWTCSSDISLKEDIQDAGSVLSIIKNIRVRDYRVKASGDRMVGVIAQEFIEVLPNNVVPVEGGLLSVKELSSWQLVKAIQEQQVMIEELQENNTNLGFTVSEIDGVKNLNFEGTIIATNIQAQNIEGMEIISENISTLEDTQVSTEQQITEINDQSLDLQTRLSSAEISIANNVARLDQHSLILDRITAINTQMYQYNMDIQVLGDMFIDGSINVSSEAIFSGQILFNQDTVGQARILTGHTEVYVPFTQEYRYQPVVTLSMLGNNSVNKFYVDEVTTAGFKIKIDGVQADNVTLNWHAFASPNARLVDSTGVVAGIQTYRPLKGLDQVFVDPLIDSSCVGYVETQGFGETHDGIDLAKYEGCIISSVGVGRVIFAGWEDISGNIVKIDHGNGIVTAYAHGTGEFFVEVGDYVDAGDPIMMMGTTGTSTGIHTHFMLKQDGTAINPKGIIPYNAIY